MLLIRKEQMKKLQESLTPKLRESIINDFKKRGFETGEDPNKRIVTLRDKSGGESLIRWDGDILTLISGENRVYRFEYDQSKQLTAITDPKGFRIVFKWDEQKRLIKINRGPENHYSFKYDSFSNLSEIEFPDKTSQFFHHDNNGNLVKFIDRNGAERTYTYSATDQMLKFIDAKGHKTRFRYSQLDAPREIEYATGDRHKFEYDKNGALSGMKVNGELQTDFKIDPIAGSMETSDSNGKQSIFLIKEDRLIEAVNENCKIKFTYDDKGRILSEDVKDKTVEYLRNGVGALIRMSVPDMEPIVYNYDKEHRIKSIQWRKMSFGIHYDSSGTLLNINYPNGICINRSINPMGLVSSMSIQMDSKSNTIVYKGDYEYDPCDRILKTVIKSNRKTRTDSYAYDGEGRLLRIESSDPNRSEFFHLDANGNRLCDKLGDAQINNTDQLINHAGTVYFYDGAGNLVSFSNADGKTLFKYNNRNQLIEFQNDHNKATYEYDAIGRRIQKKGVSLV